VVFTTKGKRKNDEEGTKEHKGRVRKKKTGRNHSHSIKKKKHGIRQNVYRKCKQEKRGGRHVTKNEKTGGAKRSKKVKKVTLKLVVIW